MCYNPPQPKPALKHISKRTQCPPNPAPSAIAIIRRPRDGALLLMECHDYKNQAFYRPLGGGIQFGEHSSQAVRRELYEEAQLELCDLRYLGAIENIFSVQGQTGHEIVMVYNAHLAPACAWAYAQDPLHAAEDTGDPFLARWLPLAHFTSPSAPPLYPTALIPLLAQLPTP